MQKNQHKSNSTSVPFEVGDEFTARVNALGEKGDGIVRVKGVVVIVPGVKKGDNIKFKIQKILPKVSFATFVSTVAPEEVRSERNISEEAFKPKQPKKEDVSHLLTTAGDTEDFGVDEDEDDEEL